MLAGVTFTSHSNHCIFYLKDRYKLPSPLDGGSIEERTRCRINRELSSPYNDRMYSRRLNISISSVQFDTQTHTGLESSSSSVPSPWPVPASVMAFHSGCRWCCHPLKHAAPFRPIRWIPVMLHTFWWVHYCLHTSPQVYDEAGIKKMGQS